MKGIFEQDKVDHAWKTFFPKHL